MEHPITPPDELVQQWRHEWVYANPDLPSEPYHYIATQAAQWGADQELEECCQWLDFYSAASTARGLRAARRPKPPSLKEQALARLTSLEKLAEAMGHCPDDTTRRALEALPND